MKVQGPGKSVGQLQQAREAGAGKGAEQAKARAPEEQIKMSSLSKLISEFRTNTDEVVDQAKVSQLKLDIRNGDFQVKPDEVAAAMIREET
ncbi:MAG TPA: flagellar biosynthesis anti-sigma factor FlgM [Polyangiales bacterium]|jgi:flagellar biosynthesis anti-sigma factor FlgM|nr:flagellar biosynthesis anti-sigma factor FlgM [Polyangiales bacterium]